MAHVFGSLKACLLYFYFKCLGERLVDSLVYWMETADIYYRSAVLWHLGDTLCRSSDLTFALKLYEHTKIENADLIVQLLCDTRLAVQKNALSWLLKLGPLVKHAKAVSQVLISVGSEASLRVLALQFLQRLEETCPPVLCEYKSVVLANLSHREPEVRTAALKTLQALASSILEGHVDLIVEQLKEKFIDWPSWFNPGPVPSKWGELHLEALKTLGGLDPGVLHQYTPLLAKRIKKEHVRNQQESKICQEALKLLQHLGPHVIETYCHDVLRLLECRWDDLHALVLATLGHLPQRTLSTYAERLLIFLDTLNRQPSELCVNWSWPWLLKHQKAALDLLGVVDSKTLTRRAAVIAELLDNPNHAFLEDLDAVSEIRTRALSILKYAEKAVLAKYEHIIVGLLADPVLAVRVAALQVIPSFSQSQLDKCAKRLSDDLARDSTGDTEDGWVQVRVESLHALSFVTPTLLPNYADAIREQLISGLGIVRSAALSTLDKLELSALTQAGLQRHASALGSCLNDIDLSNQRKAIDMLHKLLASDLVDVRYAATVALRDEQTASSHLFIGAITTSLRMSQRGGIFGFAKSPMEASAMNRDLRVAAIQLMAKLNSEVIADVILVGVGQLDDCHRVVRVAVVGFICQHIDLVCKSQSALRYVAKDSGDTALHAVAAYGHLVACQKLVRAGARVKAVNRQGKTPAVVAHEQNHADVVSFLHSRQNLTTVRGGTGDAYHAAVADDRVVTMVEWYTISLLGSAGSIGGKHSLLAVTVGPNTDAATYVIEKAARVRATSEGDESQFQNGVHISHWVDVAPNVEHDAIYRLDVSSIASYPEGIYMRHLRDIAVELGPYDVCERNCHHAALAIYNHCAIYSAQVSRQDMPNQRLTAVAYALRAAGWDVTNSEAARSTTSQSASGPVEFESASASGSADVHEGMPTRADGIIVNRLWAGQAAHLSQWIYHPKFDDMIILQNLTSDELVVYFEEIRREVRLAVGETQNIEVPRGLVHARFNFPGLLGMTSRRTRLLRQELSTGHSYRVEKDHEGRVSCFLDESLLLPDGMRIYEVSLSESGKPVQWGIVCSDNVVYVTFRGTSNVFDAIIDLGLVTHDNAEHGLRVHSGMWNALTQRSYHVLNAIYNHLRAMANTSDHHIVFCGHSLGGAYAQLSALEMIRRGLNIKAVFTFGAPQSIVPDYNSKIWSSLNAMSVLYINSYDVVPRLPSCTEWLCEALNAVAPSKSFGSFNVGLNLSSAIDVEGKISEQKSAMEEYGTVGTLMFVHKKSRNASSILSAQTRDHMRILRQKPERALNDVLKLHSMQEYASIVATIRVD